MGAIISVIISTFALVAIAVLSILSARKIDDCKKDSCQSKNYSYASAAIAIITAIVSLILSIAFM